MQSYHVFFLDRGPAKAARSRKRMEEWILRQEIERSKVLIAENEELDQEADRLSAMLVNHLHEKRKRDFEIQLLRGEIEQRKKYPLGVPPGPSPEQLRESREREVAKARRDAEFQLKCKQEADNHPMMVYLREVKANLAIDRDFYRKQREAARSKTPPPQRMPEWLEKEVVAAKELAKEAGRPFPKRLSFKDLRDIHQGRL